MSNTPVKKDLVYMTDEQLKVAGFGFLTEHPRVKVMPELGIEFSVSWSTSEFDRVERSRIVSDFDSSICSPVSEVYHYENIKHERVGKILFIGKDLAVLLCVKTSKEFSVHINSTMFVKLK